MKRLFVFAPNKYLGFGVEDAYLKQFTTKLVLIVKHHGTGDPVEFALIVALEDFIVELGVGGELSPFQLDYDIMGDCATHSLLHENPMEILP